MWRILRKKTELPTADRALPGRPSPDFEIPVMHYVNGTRIQPPFPAGLEQAMFGLAASGAPSACSGKRRAFMRPRWLRRGPDAQPDLRGSLLGLHRT